MRAENPNAFKNLIGPALLAKLGEAFERSYPAFSSAELRKLAPRLEPLELKDRVRLIRSRLRELLPESYPEALSILVKAGKSSNLEGFDLWPLTDFVQTYGLEHFDASMEALRGLTEKFTAEFAVRPFLEAHPDRTIALLRRWAVDPNHHVRRAASEGTRPRLPWGERVAWMIKNPVPGIELLDSLYLDPELYVRKSVANHLNDVSRDHPDLAIEVLTRWRLATPEAELLKLEWIIRRALRTLIKNGHRDALQLIGVVGDAKVVASGLGVKKATLRVGDTLEFAFDLVSTAKIDQKLVVDYLIHHVRSNGGLSAKVFKLKTFKLPALAKVSIAKRHSLKRITTREYYPGEHLLEIQVNGRILLRQTWKLL